MTHVGCVYAYLCVLCVYVCACGAFDCDTNLCICVGPLVLENWPNICEGVRRLLSTAGNMEGIIEAQKEAEGFLVESRPPAGGTNEGKGGGSQRSSTWGLSF